MFPLGDPQDLLQISKGIYYDGIGRGWVMRQMGKKGFTLVEMILVVVILGVMAAFAIPQLSKSVEKAALGEALSSLSVFRSSMLRYANEHDGAYPGSCQALDVWPASAGGGFYVLKSWEIHATWCGWAAADRVLIYSTKYGYYIYSDATGIHNWNAPAYVAAMLPL